MSEKEIVKVAKLASGEEVIFTELLSSFDSGRGIKIKNMLQILLIPDQKTQKVNLTFVPFMPYIEKEKPIYLDKILITAEPVKELVQNYNAAFSNLVLPNKPTLIV